MNKQLNNKRFHRVLVFGSSKKLVAVYHSLTAAAKAFKVTGASVHQALVGTTLSCKGHYFRNLSEDILLDLENDLGSLTVEEYDEMCGVKRAYHPTRAALAKGVRSKIMNKSNKTTNNED